MLRLFSLVLTLLCLLGSSVLGKVPDKVDVLIIGGGLSGLATAYNLKKTGLSYHIIELGPRIGGRVRTVRYNLPNGEEIYADSGMEEYWESNPAVALLKELELPLRHDIPVSSIKLQKKLEPLHDHDTVIAFQKRVFSKKEHDALEKFKRKLEPLSAKLRARHGEIPETLPALEPQLLKLKDVSFASWVKSQKLPVRVTEWVRVSIECEIGTTWEQISALDGFEEFHIFLGEGEESYRVIGGNDKFTDALASAVGEGNISVGKKVNRIITKNNEVMVSYLDLPTNEAHQVTAKHVVSTIPLYRVMELQLEPALSEKKRQAIASQTWGAYFKAHVFVPPKAKRFYTTKGGSELLPILSDSELGVIYDGNPDQDKGTKILSLLVTGPQAETFNMMPLDHVRAQIKVAFDKLWPGFSREIQGMEFYRFHPRAIAAWPVGRSRFDLLSDEIRKPERRIYFAGDFTETSHSDGAFFSASRVVKQILAEKK